MIAQINAEVEDPQFRKQAVKVEGTGVASPKGPSASCRPPERIMFRA